MNEQETKQFIREAYEKISEAYKLCAQSKGKESGARDGTLGQGSLDRSSGREAVSTAESATPGKQFDPQFFALASNLSNALWSAGYDTPEKMAQCLIAQFGERITPKLLAQIWSLGANTDPSIPVNWRQVYDDTVAREEETPIPIEDHPLNQQACRLLSLAKSPSLPKIMPVLQLPLLAIPEGQEDNDEALWVEAATRSNPQAILEVLEAELPDGLPEDPTEAAECVIFALKPLDPYHDLR